MAEKKTNGQQNGHSQENGGGGSNSVAFSKQNSKVHMSQPRGISGSKTLDSIASLRREDHDEKKSNKDSKAEDQNLIEFKRTGVLLMARSDAEGGNGDLLCSGMVIISRKNAWQGPILEWIPMDESNGGEAQNAAPQGASLPRSEWDVVGEAMSKRNVRPIEVELCELKSFRLSDDGNRMVIIQRDGTRHPPLIFLDEGPEQLISVIRR